MIRSRLARSLRQRRLRKVDALQKKILEDTQPGDYCYILIERLVAGAEERVLEFFDALRQNRMIVMFLLTTDETLLGQDRSNSKHSIEEILTPPLTEDDAITFVKHRLALFREDYVKKDLASYKLFPFDEANIRDVVTKAVDRLDPKRPAG